MARTTALQTSTAPDLLPDRWRIIGIFGACVASLFAAVVLAVAIGAVSVPPLAVIELTLSRLLSLPRPALYPETFDTILFEIRLPRVAITALIGAALAASGSTYQGLFRNPLADPYLVGVASGAGLGATLALGLNLHHTALGLNATPIGAFLGAVITVAVVVISAQVGRTTPVSTMLLAGVAIGSFTTAVTTFLMLLSPDGLRRAFTWLLGGYNGGGWQPFWIVLPYLIVGLIILQFNARALNVLQLDEEQARQLGINVERLKLTVVAAATLITAAAVAFGGLVGFVGLVVPHVLRMIAGPDYRRLIPLSAIGGAAFLVIADLVARTIIAPTELPVGVVTALAGAPFFILLLRRLKRSVF
ncbi:MAG: iron chelate uptake ABC transporter family permease subunit [Chloroflexi bacterium]|nr:iron chelate uptake ABC transporter family permease subunit [Chloroflexota bacterium]